MHIQEMSFLIHLLNLLIIYSNVLEIVLQIIFFSCLLRSEEEECSGLNCIVKEEISRPKLVNHSVFYRNKDDHIKLRFIL